MPIGTAHLVVDTGQVRVGEAEQAVEGRPEQAAEAGVAALLVEDREVVPARGEDVDGGNVVEGAVGDGVGKLVADEVVLQVEVDAGEAKGDLEGGAQGGPGTGTEAVGDKKRSCRRWRVAARCRAGP
jgi:hypothetical protein